MFLGLMLWIITSLIEYLVPSLLLSGLAVVLMLLFLYLSFENPKEYIDVNLSGYQFMYPKLHEQFNNITKGYNIPPGFVAEGVETKEMAEYLIEHGVNYLQGYYYARALGEAEFLDFISA